MKASLEELLQRANILDVVSQHVKLRKAGKDYMGLCPFHKEKTPSFTVSVEKQIYYCFGCKEGGNAVNFLMKYENLTFVEAFEHLGRQYGIEVERRGSGKRTGYYDALAKLCEYYKKGLGRTTTAREYLLKRGITAETADEFSLGYSDRSRGLLKSFLSASGIPNDIFLSTGIVRMKGSELYDMFSGRIVIPIVDVSKRVIGFGGRTLEKDGMPKYVNSPESSVFVKRSTLFGIDKTKGHIAEKNEVFVVEGYFDLITLYSGGLKNVVSTLGTSVTEGQISKLRNYTENITLMLDGDEAGIKSALRLISLFAEMDVNGTMVVLPEGHDPDSFIRENGIEGVLDVVAKKKPILDYYFDHIAGKQDMMTVQGKGSFINGVLPHITAIRNGVKRRLYIKRLSELTGVEEEHFGGSKYEMHHKTDDPGGRPKGTIEKKVINACIARPDLLESFRGKDVLSYIKNVDVREVISKMVTCFEEARHLDLKSFIEMLDKEALKGLVLDAAFDDTGEGQGEPEKVLLDYRRHIERQFLKEESKRITAKLVDAEKRGDEKAVVELMEQKRQVLTHIKNNFL